MSEKFALYFSHSWHRESVDLNLGVWELVKDRCNLLLDLPDDNTPKPPYFVNRIEELLRRSDLFLSVLPYRKDQTEADAKTPARGDANFKCSPYMLFEIRLAERANRPRLIIYDQRTSFVRPSDSPPHAKYVPLTFDHGPAVWRPKLEREINTWLQWADDNMSPKVYEYSPQSLVFLPESIPKRSQAMKQIERVLETAYNKKPFELKESISNDAELFRLLASGGLLVSEVSDLQNLAVYCVAHALFIPSVRLMYRPLSATRYPNLPWLLQGHPKGYQEDIIEWKEPKELAAAVKVHAEAMLAAEKVITTFEEGKRLFESRRYVKHKIFISHSMRPDQRELVEHIEANFRSRSIEYFEYFEKNEAGEKWKPRLQAELGKTTHFVLLLADKYEQSPACVAEIKWVLEHRTQIRVIPFLVDGRTTPHVEFNEEHHKLLGSDVDSSALAVVQQVERVLLAQ